MRKGIAGLIVVGLFCGVTLAQQATQPGGAQPRPTAPPARPGVVQPQAGQPGAVVQPGQPGAVVQPGQPGAVVQPGQPGAVIQPRPALPGGQAGQLQPGLGGQQAASADQQVAACLHVECSNHIEISKLGQSKAESEEVRDFAEKMVSDHTQGCQELQQLAGNLAADHGQQPGRTGAEGGQRSAGGQLDWISVKKEIGQQCLTTLKQELGAKQGIEFDKCFMGLQISTHMKAVDELKVLKNHVSSELGQKLDKQLQMAQQHLQLAKQIDQKLKDRPSERVSRRPEGKQ
jgi:predicted outer membrane protein